VQPGSYVEAMIDPPVAEGVWPAFWLLGSNLPEVGWPASGELDVMEVFGNRSALGQYVHVSRLTDAKADNPFGGRPEGGPVLATSGSAHRFGVYFDDSEVRFYIDRQQTVRLTADDARRSDRAWPFGQPFFLLVNIAIGGRSGDPADTDFPRRMIVEPISIWKGGPPFERSRC
jgi:beta-glucanase (GH16 family)